MVKAWAAHHCQHCKGSGAFHIGLYLLVFHQQGLANGACFLHSQEWAWLSPSSARPSSSSSSHPPPSNPYATLTGNFCRASTSHQLTWASSHQYSAGVCVFAWGLQDRRTATVWLSCSTELWQEENERKQTSDFYLKIIPWKKKKVWGIKCAFWNHWQSSTVVRGLWGQTSSASTQSVLTASVM